MRKKVRPIFVETQNEIVVITVYTSSIEATMVKVSYDREVDALYIRLKETTVTTDRVEEGVALDYDASDRLAGIEILDARKRLDNPEAFNGLVSGTTGSVDHVGLTLSTSPQLSAIQLHVLDALRGVETKEYRLGDWYLGALYALENTYNPDRISQAAQSFRELIEKLPRVVLKSDMQNPPFSSKRQQIHERFIKDKIRYKDGWKGRKIDAKLDKTLRNIDEYLQMSQQRTRKGQLQNSISEFDPMAHQMGLDIQKRKRDAFHSLWNHLEGFAHHRSISAADEEKFKGYVATLEQLVYDFLAPITAQDQDEIQAILNRSEHSEGDAETLYKLISRRGANYVYFFTNAADPAWIPFLKSKGFFKNPPKAEYLSDGYVRFPFWPELQYLEEVCVCAPADVLDLVLKLPAVDNPKVYANILDIALKLDGERSAQLLPKMLEYAGLEHQYFTFKFPDLLAHWISTDQTEAAADLAQILVQFAPDAESEEKQEILREIKKNRTDNFEVQLGKIDTQLRPIPRFRRYRKILNEHVRPLAEKEPFKVAAMLIDATARMIRLGTHEDDLEDETISDYSEIWCPRLNKPRSDYPDPKESLAHTLTFACERVFENEFESIELLDCALRRHSWDVFKRIRQHHYASHPCEQTKPWIREFIVAHEYGRLVYGYEFQRMIRLAAEHFGEELLTKEERTRIFDAVLGGPSMHDFRFLMGDRFTETTFEQWRRKFHRKQFRPFAQLLFGEYADKFRELEADETEGEITDESYSRFRKPEGGMVTSRSPRSPQELATLSDVHLLEYINEWQDERQDSDNWLVDITIEALADAFQVVFKESIIPDASRYSFWIKNRDNILRPIYIRVMIDVMQHLVKAKEFDKLEEWFEFCKWVLLHPDPEQDKGVNIGRLGDGSRDHPNWHTSRRAVCDFIEACIEKDVDVPLWTREHLVGLLKKLCTEYDWRLDNNKPVLLTRDDQLTEAINTTRGRALENLVEFGFWIRRQESEADVPELKAILERRFGPEAAFPLTIPEYAIMGRLYQSIFDLDCQLAESRRSFVFPQHIIPAWFHAFASFLRYSRPQKQIFKVMRCEFEFALDNLGQLEQHEQLEDELKIKLGLHLFRYYVWGVLPLEGTDSLFCRFYLATDNERGHWAGLFTYVGRILRKSEKQIDQVVKDRIIAFFEWRLKTEEALELRKFSEWLEAECLDTEWRLEALSRVLKIRGILNETENLEDGRDDDPETLLPSDATRQLRGMLPEHTPRVVECFARLTDVLPRSGGFYIPTDDAKAILKAGLEHKDERVRKNAERTKEILFKRGILKHTD